MNLKNIIIGIKSIIKSIKITFLHSFNKRETILYPDIPIKITNRFRGRVILTKNDDGSERCVACNLCSVVCPVGCIYIQRSKNKNGYFYPKYFSINFARCIFCGFCEEACPTYAIQLSSDFEMSKFKRKDLLYKKKDLLISGFGKYSKYNFYKISGIKIKNKNKGYGINEKKPIDIKTLMP